MPPGPRHRAVKEDPSGFALLSDRIGPAMMTEDEIAAVHESAHAVFAAFGQWTKLAGPVVLKGPGHGDVVMSTDGEAIRRSIVADRRFDRDLPRIHLIRSIMAGPVVERMLVERGLADLDEQDLRAGADIDDSVIAEQLGKLDPPRPGLLEQLEREVRERLERPEIWSAVERFAEILIVRRRLEADEASAILAEIAGRSPVDVGPAEARGRGLGTRIALVGRVLRRACGLRA